MPQRPGSKPATSKPVGTSIGICHICRGRAARIRVDDVQVDAARVELAAAREQPLVVRIDRQHRVAPLLNGIRPGDVGIVRRVAGHEPEGLPGLRLVADEEALQSFASGGRAQASPVGETLASVFRSAARVQRLLRNGVQAACTGSTCSPQVARLNRRMTRSRPAALASSRLETVAIAGLAAAAATAFWVELRARQAERRHPPRGRFVDVDGVKLHYVERGTGDPVVLIHGNMVSLEDFEASGLIGRLAERHRVIAFDRPGFGHSPRPRDRLWTPAAQATLLQAALHALGVDRTVVVGHSMGAMVALQLALDHPMMVNRLVLLGGYYYPSLRVDALLTAPVALPVLGDAMRYTATAVTARLTLNAAVKGMFAPNAVPPHYLDVVSREMMVRPIQLRANEEDAAFMIPAARAAAERHGELSMPVVILAGADDLVVDPKAHSQRLQGDVPSAELTLVPGAGHMVHHWALERVADAIG